MLAQRLTIAALLFPLLVSSSEGQFRRGASRGISHVRLVQISQVQEELGLSAEQLSKVEEVVEQARSQRISQRPDFRELTDEEREAFAEAQRQAAAKADAAARKAIDALLNDDQRTRLQQIFIQLAGSEALDNADVREKLQIDDQQYDEIKKTREQVLDDMRIEMQELFQSGDRQSMREKMLQLRQSSEATILGQLSEQQQNAFSELRGDKFELPRSILFGGGRPRNKPATRRPRRPE